MIIPIFFHIRYKNYPLAPYATAASYRLGILFSVPVLILNGFIAWCIMFCAACRWFPDSSLSLIVPLFCLVPAYVGLFHWKKKREAKIERKAMEETRRNLSMTKEEKAKRDRRAKIIAYILIAAILLSPFFVYILAVIFCG